MKKLLLNLGAIALVSAPITTIVACGNNSDKETQEEEKLEPTPSEGDTQPKPEATPSKKTAEVGKKEEKELPAILEFQMRENIYSWKRVPDVLKNKKEGDVVPLEDLGLSKSAFWSLKSTDGNSIDDSSVEIKINVKTKLKGSKIVLTVNLQQGENTSKTSKDITINYNFLTFEAVKNATNKNLEEILKIVKNESKTKEAHLRDIKALEWEDKDKELFENYWTNVSESKEVYYMLNFMKASTSPDGIFVASIGVIDQKDGVDLSPDDKLLLMKRKIFNAKFDIKKVARGIINRFLLQDPDLKPDLIGYAAEVKEDAEGKKELIAKEGWGGATKTMGGDETISYILDKIGYTLVLPKEN